MKLYPKTSSNLSRWHKRTIIVVSVLLVLTGGAWMIPHYTFFAFPDLDGPESRSLLHYLLISHGVLAYGAAILLGTLLGRHIPAGLRRKHLPISGVIGLVLVAGLVASALLLYYAASPEIRETASITHQVIGVLAAAAVWRHIVVWGSSRSKRPPKE